MEVWDITDIWILLAQLWWYLQSPTRSRQEKREAKNRNASENVLEGVLRHSSVARRVTGEASHWIARPPGHGIPW